MQGPRTAAASAVIPVLRPQLPTTDEILPYLREIDASRQYSNFGPLLVRLEHRLADLFAVDRTQLVALSNGTTALSAALIAAGAKQGTRCIVPSWSFVASAAAAWAANLEPYFVDVSPETWMLDPEQLARREDLDNVGAVMVVSAFGAPVDTAAWDAFTQKTGIPVVIDGAAAFDTVITVPKARAGAAPVMISLHATKSFGIGEGAVVISQDPAVIHRVRQICNFGVWGSPEGQILGYNGKLSEYHAAIGLAALDAWPQRRAAIAALTERYAQALAGFDRLSVMPGFGEGWVASYCNILVDGSLATLVDRLTYMGIETRRWWRAGIHTQTAYAGFPRDPLPVTERLAAANVALPFFHDLSEQQVARVLECLGAALR